MPAQTDESPITEEHGKAAMEFAMQAIGQIPKDDPIALEAHITAVLIVFWGALWGTMGSEYARDFIAAQLQSMAPGVPSERFSPPQTH